MLGVLWSLDVGRLALLRRHRTRPPQLSPLRRPRGTTEREALVPLGETDLWRVWEAIGPGRGGFPAVSSLELGCWTLGAFSPGASRKTQDARRCGATSD